MKNFLLVLFCCAACAATAQTGQPVQAPIVIKRVGSTDTIATTFQQAYDIARNGDAIYLSGGIFNAPLTFNKRLFVYGTGYNADSSNAMATTRISGQYNFSLGKGSSGSFIVGLNFLSMVYIADTISTINFQRCKINSLNFAIHVSTVNLTESVVTQSIYYSAGIYSAAWTVNILNCIIDGSITTPYSSSNANLLIKNSIILATGGQAITYFKRVEIDLLFF